MISESRRHCVAVTWRWLSHLSTHYRSTVAPRSAMIEVEFLGQLGETWILNREFYRWFFNPDPMVITELGYLLNAVGWTDLQAGNLVGDGFIVHSSGGWMPVEALWDGRMSKLRD